MSDRPNIFDYATSELSQDAFFAWLLKWAEDGYKKPEPDLHECARGLLKAFFNEYYKDFQNLLGNDEYNYLQDINSFASVKRIESVEVNRQVKRIDLWLTIKTDIGSFYVVIEDKIGAKPRKNQLKTYRDLVINDCGKKKKSCFIYLKTGELNQSEIDKVKNEKYSLFDLNSVYEKLRKCNSKSEIFQGYFFKLEAEYFFWNFKQDNKEAFDKKFGNNLYKHGVWRNDCYWFYGKRKLNCKLCSKYYLALDVYLEKGNELVFCFHIISSLDGTWITDSDMQRIKKIQGIIARDSRYQYMPEDNYYEKKQSFKNQSMLNCFIRNEIFRLFA
ncbi:MAG: PD-(D/E)XK nuclease family protein [Treponema sp.]|nr:PD-(D/E)XK nuclease family protein [Treponema sp.]